jgi:hypothetical protein
MILFAAGNSNNYSFETPPDNFASLKMGKLYSQSSHSLNTVEGLPSLSPVGYSAQMEPMFFSAREEITRHQGRFVAK